MTKIMELLTPPLEISAGDFSLTSGQAWEGQYVKEMWRGGGMSGNPEHLGTWRSEIITLDGKKPMQPLRRLTRFFQPQSEAAVATTEEAHELDEITQSVLFIEYGSMCGSQLRVRLPWLTNFGSLRVLQESGSPPSFLTLSYSFCSESFRFH